MEQQEQVNDTKLAVVTQEYDAHRSSQWHAHYKKRLMPHKLAANYAAQIIEDPANYTFDAWATPRWSNAFAKAGGLRIFDETCTEVATFSWNKSVYYDVIQGVPWVYAATMYVLTAMNEARARVRAIGQQEMTPAEIEKEFGLSRGTVRKYIFDHRDELFAARVVRQADARTLLCKRGWAIHRWGNKS